MKGQIGVEHLVIVGLTIAVLVPGIYLFYQSTSENYTVVQQEQVNEAANSIITQANVVNQLGIDSKQSLIVELPENFKNISLEDNYTLVVTYEGPAGINEIAYPSTVKLLEPNYGSGFESVRPGKVKLTFINTGEGVCVATPEGSCDPSCGNGIIEPALGEVCDTLDFGSLDCTDPSLGFTGGNLACSSDCTYVITDFCVGCFSSGDICLDEGLDVSLGGSAANYALSNYVSAVHGETNPRWVGAPPQIYYQNISGFSQCGPPGVYKACRGGGVELDNSFIDRNKNLLFKVEVKQPDDGSNLNQDWSLQCDGMTYFVEDIDGSNTVADTRYFECVTDNNPYIGIMGLGSRSIDWELVEVIDNCGLTTSCQNMYEDTNWYCMAENHAENAGEVSSDFVELLDEDKLTVRRWTDVRNGTNGPGGVPVDYSMAAGYEDACEYVYGVEDANDGPLRINANKLVDHLSPYKRYYLDINVIGGLAGADNERFAIKCGSQPTVQVPSTGNDGLPYNGETSSSQAHVMIMKTVSVFCTFPTASSEYIEIRHTNAVDDKIEFERLRLREECT